ncbi:MAG: DNA repair protein RecO [Coriobacteriia bacterium]|nr:DNA repair protein RecO [Coriobacteriia bacterium]
MPSYTAEALVLAKTKLAETDLILTLLTSGDSQIRAVAKGARKPGAKLCGLSEPFTVIEAKFHPGKSLDIISEARGTCAYGTLRHDYNRLMAGSVALELAAQATNDGDSIARLYALTCAYLDVLNAANTTDVQLPTLLAAYLLKTMALIGYSPEHELCAHNPQLAVLLGSTFAGLAESVHSSSPSANGPDSSANGPATYSASDTQAVLAPISPAALRATIRFTEKHLPATLKSLRYYQKSL